MRSVHDRHKKHFDFSVQEGALLEHSIKLIFPKPDKKPHRKSDINSSGVKTMHVYLYPTSNHSRESMSQTPLGRHLMEHISEQE